MDHLNLYKIVEKISAQAKANPEDVKIALKVFKEMAEEVLYEDQFCKLTSTNLEIKRYHASIESKFVPLNEIRKIWYAKQRMLVGQEALLVNDNGWSTLGMIWWAHDPTRQRFGTNNNVVIDTGEEWRKGFSVTDLDSFGYCLYEMIGKSAEFFDGLPKETVSFENPPLFH